MENPNSWTEVTNIIDEAIRAWKKDQKDGFCGYSLPMYIQTQLESKGYTIKKK